MEEKVRHKLRSSCPSGGDREGRFLRSLNNCLSSLFSIIRAPSHLFSRE